MPAPETAPELPREVAAVLALQRSAGNAAATAMLARVATAPVRLLQREPDEEKVKARAYELWLRKGSPNQTREQADADYFEAQREVRIEERAYANYQGRTGGNKEQTEEERRADYYEAERQVEEEAKAAAGSVVQAEKEAETPKEPAAVEEAEVQEAPQEEAKDVKKEEPPPVAEHAPAKPKYVPPHKQKGYVPIAPVAAKAAALPPGWLSDAQLAKLGFWKKQGRWQKDLKPWYGFHVHISVNPQDNAFDEFHVKFDLGDEHRVFYFYDVTGAPKWDKSTGPGAAKEALKADGVKVQNLGAALKEMDSVAKGEADFFASKLH